MTNYILNMLGLEETQIASGAAVSDGVSLGGLRLFGIVMPDAWTAANITVQVSHDAGVTWRNLHDAAGNEVTVQAAAGRYIALDPLLYAAAPMVRLRSGTAATPVNQAAARAVQLVVRSV